ncbi:MAG: 3-hydroxyacyl-ACP dehydratase FabZ [Acholeplasmataceae bacterium]|nr:3-hydroxyacyl-ACP dehydratase FabZ [Acholeplasmataceae bacterium]
MTKEEIKAIIPHREPFLLLDEITTLRPLDFGVGRRYVDPDDEVFKGHFPEAPVLPGVLIIEALAQVGAVVLLSHPDYHGKIAYFTGIKNAKFRKSVFPGDEMRLECTLSKMRMGFGIGQAKAFVGDQLVCEADISFVAA